MISAALPVLSQVAAQGQPLIVRRNGEDLSV
jgi:hypothetical protein